MGAFNGSGIALSGESWNKDQHRIFTLYFQHWTGDIRYMQKMDTTEQKWRGGTRSETVATDAKNATAISTVAYALNSTQYVSRPAIRATVNNLKWTDLSWPAVPRLLYL
jgi:hypothetical protein